jgi:hypothetical protein
MELTLIILGLWLFYQRPKSLGKEEVTEVIDSHLHLKFCLVTLGCGNKKVTALFIRMPIFPI